MKGRTARRTANTSLATSCINVRNGQQNCSAVLAAPAVPFNPIRAVRYSSINELIAGCDAGTGRSGRELSANEFEFGDDVVAAGPRAGTGAAETGVAGIALSGSTKCGLSSAAVVSNVHWLRRGGRGRVGRARCLAAGICRAAAGAANADMRTCLSDGGDTVDCRPTCRTCARSRAVGECGCVKTAWSVGVTVSSPDRTICVTGAADRADTGKTKSLSVYVWAELVFG